MSAKATRIRDLLPLHAPIDELPILTPIQAGDIQMDDRWLVLPSPHHLAVARAVLLLHPWSAPTAPSYVAPPKHLPRSRSCRSPSREFISPTAGAGSDPCRATATPCRQAVPANDSPLFQPAEFTSNGVKMSAPASPGGTTDLGLPARQLLVQRTRRPSTGWNCGPGEIALDRRRCPRRRRRLRRCLAFLPISPIPTAPIHARPHQLGNRRINNHLLTAIIQNLVAQYARSDRPDRPEPTISSQTEAAGGCCRHRAIHNRPWRWRAARKPMRW